MTPPDPERQTFRFYVKGTLPARSKQDCTEQLRRCVQRMGGTVTGCAASEHLEMGGVE